MDYAPIHRPALIAHRGDAANYPENSLAAVRSALACGLSWVEVDVQLSADLQPVVIHDADLARTAGIQAPVGELSLAELQAISAHEPERLGPRFSPTPVASLSRVAAVMADYPQARLFVEIKIESMERVGREKVLRAVLESLGEMAHHCIIISFDPEVLRRTRRVSNLPVGLVLAEYDLRARTGSRALAPEFAFVNGKKVPEGENLWPETYQWAVYEITEASAVLEWGRRGAALVESMQACALRRELEHH